MVVVVNVNTGKTRINYINYYNYIVVVVVYR